MRWAMRPIESATRASLTSPPPRGRWQSGGHTTDRHGRLTGSIGALLELPGLERSLAARIAALNRVRS
jgi:hypothetical protein